MSSLYTICDDKKEKECRQKLCDFLKDLGTHREFTKSIIKIQQDHAEKLWILSTKFLILERGCPDLKIYPEDVTKQVIGNIISERNNKMEQIFKAVNSLSESHQKLSRKCKCFENSAQKLDWKTQSSFLHGDERQKSLDFYMNAASDIIFYFHVFQTNMKRFSQMLSVDDINSIIKFKNCLSLDANFLNYLNSVIKYNNCFDLLS